MNLHHTLILTKNKTAVMAGIKLFTKDREDDFTIIDFDKIMNLKVHNEYAVSMQKLIQEITDAKSTYIFVHTIPENDDGLFFRADAKIDQAFLSRLTVLNFSE